MYMLAVHTSRFYSLTEYKSKLGLNNDLRRVFPQVNREKYNTSPLELGQPFQGKNYNQNNDCSYFLDFPSV